MRNLVAAALVALALAGCESAGDINGYGWTVLDGELYHKVVDLPDGRGIECVVYANGSQAGLSCDWGGAR